MDCLAGKALVLKGDCPWESPGPNQKDCDFSQVQPSRRAFSEHPLVIATFIKVSRTSGLKEGPGGGLLGTRWGATHPVPLSLGLWLHLCRMRLVSDWNSAPPLRQKRITCGASKEGLGVSADQFNPNLRGSFMILMGNQG